jgi:CHAP domain
MSLDTTLARIAQIETALGAPSPASAATLATGSSTATPSGMSTNFANTLQGAMTSTGTQALDGAAPSAGSSTGSAIVSAAASQIGQTEQPPGSNNSPAIAAYRTATAGAAAGEPWCAYFVSWAARQAGEPLGAQGQGFGYVGDIWSWAQKTGRAIPNGPGVVPAPGDLIVFGDHHVGIVEKVLPNGSIETIEGNYNNRVSQVIRGSGEATGYVRMGG